MNRFDCLHAASAAITNNESIYGTPVATFSRVAELWSAVFDVPFTPLDVALALILLKVARAHNGPHLDNWIDIAGYAALGAELEESLNGES